MQNVQFGVVINRHFQSWEVLFSFAQRAEALGFDSLWVPEHALSHLPEVDPLVVLAAVAVKTHRIRLGTCVLRLPLRNPVILARALSSLDTLCSGRLTVGIGVGGEITAEFEASGVPLKQRGKRADEAIQVMKQLWTNGSATYQGQFYRLDGAGMEPKPIQHGGPPIWIGGRQEAALRRAGRWGDGFFPYFSSPDRYKQSLGTIRQYAVECGRVPDAIFPAIVQYFCLGDLEEALASARVDLRRNYNLTDAQIDRYCLHGPPARIIRGLEPFIAAGARHIVVDAACPPEGQSRQLELFGTQVLPYFKA